jgi:hypothetical protein
MVSRFRIVRQRRPRDLGADKERQEKNDAALIIAMLLSISIASGLVIQYLIG